MYKQKYKIKYSNLIGGASSLLKLNDDGTISINGQYVTGNCSNNGLLKLTTIKSDAIKFIKDSKYLVCDSKVLTIDLGTNERSAQVWAPYNTSFK